MKPLTIGIDLDGVISYGGALKRDYIKKHFKRDCPNPGKFSSGLTDNQYNHQNLTKKLCFSLCVSCL